MSKKKVHQIAIGKRSKGDPKFRLFSESTNPNNLVVANYGVVMRDGMPTLEIVKVYKLVDILNDVIDDYHTQKTSNEV